MVRLFPLFISLICTLHIDAQSWEELNEQVEKHYKEGNYTTALKYAENALSHAEREFGEEHEHYSTGLNNVAALSRIMGQYDKALPLYLKALKITAKNQGIDSPDYGSRLNNLAVFYTNMGLYDKALPLYLEALDNAEKAYGKEHPTYDSRLFNLAGLYSNLGQYDKSMPLYLEALESTEKALGKANPKYCNRLNNLAVVYRSLGQYDKALPLAQEAMENTRDVLGETHPEYGNRLKNLALLYSQIGQGEKALPIYMEALENAENALGKDHPQYRDALWGLAQLHSQNGAYDKAEILCREAAHITHQLLLRATQHSSERDLGNYLRLEADYLASIPSWTHSRRYSEGMNELAYDNALFQNGFLLQAAGQLRRLSTSSPKADSLASLLRSCHIRLSKEYAKPISQRKGVSDLVNMADAFEGQLARAVPGFANTMQQVNWKEVHDALLPGEAAVEFIHFNITYPKKTDSIVYAALLIRPGDPNPIYIPLFEEKQLDHLTAENQVRKADYVNELYAWTDRSFVKLGGEKKSLYTLIWDKIEAAGLEGIQTIYYASSGVLHRLNLGAIAIDHKSNLSDKYHLVKLNSTRQVAIGEIQSDYTNDAILFTGVDYNMKGDTIMDNNSASNLALTLEAVRAESALNGGNWDNLPWTKEEGLEIGETLTKSNFRVHRYSGMDATEEIFKTIGKDNNPSPRILHIATHGFFFPDPKQRKETSNAGEPVFKWSDNPMIRSGLILAGGNYAWQHGRSFRPDKEDGILTAYEISQMDLSNTELVVLSACETGLGDIQGSEGVYGMQRAFKIAGAKYMIMSLWKVRDRETMAFMTTFYQYWIEEGLSIQDAFRETQLSMRNRFFDPYSWGAFVLLK